MTALPPAADVQRRLLLTIVAGVAVFASTLLYASLIGYPSWMWWFVMVGLFVPPAVVAVALLMVVQHQWRLRQART